MITSDEKSFPALPKVLVLNEKKTFYPISFFAYAYIPAFLIWKFINIEPLDENSQVAGVAGTQIIYWVGIISLFSLSTYQRLQGQSFHVISSRFSVALLGLITGIMTGTTALALKGSQFWFGATWGDLGALIARSNQAYYDGWPTPGYPKLWTGFVGNISRLIGETSISLYKPVSIIAIPVFVFLIFCTFRFTFSTLTSAIIVLLLTWGFSEWKILSELTSIAILIYIPLLIKFGDSANSKFKSIRHSVVGALLGIAVCGYYGMFYWLIPAIGAMMIFDAKNIIKPRMFSEMIDIVFGFTIVLTIVEISPLFSWGPLRLVFVIFILLLFRYLAQFSAKDSVSIFLVNFRTIILAFIICLMLSAFVYLSIDVNDYYFYTNMGNRLIPSVGALSIYALPLFFIVPVLLLSQIVRRDQEKVLLICLTTFLLSPLLVAVSFAFLTVVDGDIRLWPRAIYSFNTIWTTYLVVIACILAYSQNVQSRLKQLLVLARPVGITTTMYLVGVPVLIAIGAITGVKQYELLPKEGNGAWMSQMTCQQFDPLREGQDVALTEFLKKYCKE